MHRTLLKNQPTWFILFVIDLYDLWGIDTQCWQQEGIDDAAEKPWLPTTSWLYAYPNHQLHHCFQEPRVRSVQLVRGAQISQWDLLDLTNLLGQTHTIYTTRHGTKHRMG